MDLRLLRYFVTVADEGHIGRAAARLGMTQPPMSRAMHALEADLGVPLLVRTARGVALTGPGETLHAEARALLERADRLRERVRGTAGPTSIAVGTLADTADVVGARLVAAFRARHPHVAVTVHEADLGDPSAGLRAGLVDVALTRTPFDDTGLRTLPLSSEPVGLVVHDDDPLATRQTVTLADLTDRRWVRLPAGTDPVWVAYWTGGPPPTDDGPDDGPAARTIQECLRSVLWNRTSALAPVEQALPPGLTIVPVTDRPRSRLVLAWRRTSDSPLIRSFAQAATETFRQR